MVCLQRGCLSNVLWHRCSLAHVWIADHHPHPVAKPQLQCMRTTTQSRRSRCQLLKQCFVVSGCVINWQIHVLLLLPCLASASVHATYSQPASIQT
jgi:hypothetical protein